MDYMYKCECARTHEFFCWFQMEFYSVLFYVSMSTSIATASYIKNKHATWFAHTFFLFSPRKYLCNLCRPHMQLSTRVCVNKYSNVIIINMYSISSEINERCKYCVVKQIQRQTECYSLNDIKIQHCWDACIDLEFLF